MANAKMELPKSNLGRALRLVRLNTRARDAVKFLRDNGKNDIADSIEEICGEWMELQEASVVVEAAKEYAAQHAGVQS